MSPVGSTPREVVRGRWSGFYQSGCPQSVGEPFPRICPENQQITGEESEQDTRVRGIPRHNPGVGVGTSISVLGTSSPAKITEANLALCNEPPRQRDRVSGCVPGDPGGARTKGRI